MTNNLAIQPKKKRFRSPPYPMFDLAEAVGRAKQFQVKALHHYVGSETLVEAWELKSVDGKLWRTAAALKQYGLLTDNGSGKSRKFQITDIANRIILDEDPDSEKRKSALKSAVLTPMIYRELWKKFKTADGLADTVIRTYLTIDRTNAGEAPYSSSAAEEVLSRYRASLAFAGLTEDVPLTNSDELQGNEGSSTGIPLKDVEKVTLPPIDKSDKPNLNVDTKEHEVGKPEVLKKEISAHVEGGRLKITANVDAKEIEALQKMLEKYKEILEMLD